MLAPLTCIIVAHLLICAYCKKFYFSFAVDAESEKVTKEGINLIKSLTYFGKSIREHHVHVCVSYSRVNNLESVIDRLSLYDVIDTITYSRRFDGPWAPTLNKLCSLDVSIPVDEDAYLIYLDSDILLTRDPVEYLDAYVSERLANTKIGCGRPWDPMPHMTFFYNFTSLLPDDQLELDLASVGLTNDSTTNINNGDTPVPVSPAMRRAHARMFDSMVWEDELMETLSGGYIFVGTCNTGVYIVPGALVADFSDRIRLYLEKAARGHFTYSGVGDELSRTAGVSGGIEADNVQFSAAEADMLKIHNITFLGIDSYVMWAATYNLLFNLQSDADADADADASLSSDSMYSALNGFDILPPALNYIASAENHVSRFLATPTGVQGNYSWRDADPVAIDERGHDQSGNDLSPLFLHFARGSSFRVDVDVHAEVSADGVSLSDINPDTLQEYIFDEIVALYRLFDPLDSSDAAPCGVHMKAQMNEETESLLRLGVGGVAERSKLLCHFLPSRRRRSFATVSYMALLRHALGAPRDEEGGYVVSVMGPHYQPSALLSELVESGPESELVESGPESESESSSVMGPHYQPSALLSELVESGPESESESSSVTTDETALGSVTPGMDEVPPAAGYVSNYMCYLLDPPRVLVSSATLFSFENPSAGSALDPIDVLSARLEAEGGDGAGGARVFSIESHCPSEREGGVGSNSSSSDGASGGSTGRCSLMYKLPVEMLCNSAHFPADVGASDSELMLNIHIGEVKMRYPLSEYLKPAVHVVREGKLSDDSGSASLLYMATGVYFEVPYGFHLPADNVTGGERSAFSGNKDHVTVRIFITWGSSDEILVEFLQQIKLVTSTLNMYSSELRKRFDT